MNNLRSLFFTILCCSVIFGTSDVVRAQSGTGSDKVLVAGKSGVTQSDVDKLIQFYEWAFRTGFTADERKSYRSLVVGGFREDPATSRRNTDTLLSVLPKVLSADAEAQAKMRRVFNEGFEADLRAAGDEGSRMLLAIYERGRRFAAVENGSAQLSSSHAVSVTAKNSSPNSDAGADSQNLVGSWTRSEGGGRGDDGTGKTTYNSGLDTTFQFRLDGTMLFTVKKKVLSITQCRITETTTIPGTYTVAGGDVTMSLGAGRSVGTSSCEAKGNFDNTLSASTVTKSYTVKRMESIFRPDKPRILCFDGAEGDACFELTTR
jgi:hypothetical protein